MAYDQNYRNRKTHNIKNAPAIGAEKGVRITSTSNPYAPKAFSSKAPARMDGINPNLAGLHIQFRPVYPMLPELHNEPAVAMPDQAVLGELSQRQ